MTYEMGSALKQDVPEPPRTLEADTIMDLHRHRQHRRRTATVVGALALAVVAVPSTLLGVNPVEQEAAPAAGGTLRVSALETTEAIPDEWSPLTPVPPGRGQPCSHDER